MTVEKVLLTKEQALLIEKFKEREVKLDELLDLKLRYGFYGFIKDENKCLNDLSATEIATVFLVGYEVEMTPEDSIKVFYKQHDNNTGEFHKEYAEGVMLGVAVTLKHLGIEIEGVNK